MRQVSQRILWTGYIFKHDWKLMHGVLKIITWRDFHTYEKQMGKRRSYICKGQKSSEH